MSNITNIFRKENSNNAIDNRIFQFKDQDPAIMKAWGYKFMKAYRNTRDKKHFVAKWAEYASRNTRIIALDI
jgi:hypothetical protein